MCMEKGPVVGPWLEGVAMPAISDSGAAANICHPTRCSARPPLVCLQPSLRPARTVLGSAMVTTSPGCTPLARRLAANCQHRRRSWPRVSVPPPLPSRRAGASSAPSNTDCSVVSGRLMAARAAWRSAGAEGSRWGAGRGERWVCGPRFGLNRAQVCFDRHDRSKAAHRSAGKLCAGFWAAA